MKSEVLLSVSDAAFTISPAKVTADQFNRGIDVKLTYTSPDVGWKRASLNISGGGLSKSVILTLRILSYSDEIVRVYPQILKGTPYKTTDANVTLQLNVDATAQTQVSWKGDGVFMESKAYVFSPKNAGAGNHYLYWTYGNMKGKVKVVVE